jgi:protein-L-isoaspartate(D-aspartate) O-methyltransferase
MGYSNINVHHANGYLGWQIDAPYDRIICTAAPTAIPEILIEQLSPNGIMILPVGANLLDQSLYIIKKDSHGKVSKERSLGVRFVPMIK